MNGILATIKREILTLISNRFMLFIIFVLPLFFVCMTVSTFISGVAIDLPIAVLDEDNSDVSRSLIRSIKATPTCQIQQKVTNLLEGERLINGGNVYAFVVIPRKFKEDLSLGKTPDVVCYYNNQMILVGGIIIKDIQSAIATFISKISAQIQMKAGIPKYAISSKITPITLDERVKSNPYSNYSYFLTYAAIAHIFQVVITLVAIWSVGREFREGTTKKWLNTASNSIVNAVVGKLLPYNTIFFAYILLIYIFYVIFCTAPFNGNFLFTAFGTWIFIFAYQMMGMFFVALLSNLRFAMSVGAFYTSLGFSFSGMTFPSIAIPDFGRLYSALLPIRPFVNIVIDQSLRGFAPIYDIKYIFWMLALAVFGIISLPLLKKHIQDESLCYQI